MKKPTVMIIKASPWRTFHLWKEHPEYSAILNIVKRYQSKVDFVLVGNSGNPTSSFCLGDNIVAWDIKNTGIRGSVSYYLNLLVVLLRHRANLVIILGLPQIPVVAFSCLLSTRKYIPIFIGEFEYHGWKTLGLILHLLNFKLLELVLRTFSTTIQKAYALSEFVRYGVEKMAPNLKRISVISYPISPKFCVLENKSAISYQKPIILTVAGIEPRKGLDILIRAASRIEEDFRVVIKGSIRDQIYMRKLQKMVEMYGLQEKVIFDTRLIDYDSLVSYYNSAYLFVFPTREDCLGVVVLEALHCGLPVIGTSVGGVPEMIENGVNGVLVKPNDTQKLADTISFFLSDKNRRDRFARNIRAGLLHYYAGKIPFEEALDKSIAQLLRSVEKKARK